ncbi:hypothetical protein B0I32_1609 [Nonomuraea fuscirosea]|uniref:Uncharacterized protein n=1 Tax=Nonomuraea fuscirosea TaxID=1291556 RepID=A0A2T0LK41_9ACTN|nr:hypothetical protein [Nonomuraea fuscirosea]PRX43103.1 hypothetical protein B0I32_1609 [Nonomuraea fuscirosea]
MAYIAPDKAAASCVACFAWGVLPGRYCRACYTFGQLHQVSECTCCHRLVPVKKSYCRLCWLQASLEAKDQVTILEPFLRQFSYQQLFFTNMHRQRSKGRGPRIGRAGRRGLRAQPVPSEPVTVPHSWEQLRLPLQTRRDYLRFERRRQADLTNPALIDARRIVASLAERCGWTRGVIRIVDRALVLLLSTHTPGDKIRFSDLFPALRARGLSVGRTVEVLIELGVLDDDRISVFETWLKRGLGDLSPGIHTDVEHWLRTLHDGGPRARPRSQATCWSYLRLARPALLAWQSATIISVRSPATTYSPSSTPFPALNAITR